MVCINIDTYIHTYIHRWRPDVYRTANPNSHRVVSNKLPFMIVSVNIDTLVVYKVYILLIFVHFV